MRGLARRIEVGPFRPDEATACEQLEVRVVGVVVGPEAAKELPSEVASAGIDRPDS